MVGQTLTHYKIVEKLGEGGMGVVWKALDTKLDREVAIKVLPDELARDSEHLARFEREAKLLATLNHRNIAAIYGLDEADGKRFLDAVAEAGADGRMKLVQSNGRSMNQARNKENKVAFALTDTDDAWVAIREGDPVVVIYPDQGEGRPGAVLIPNTVALVKGRPHPGVGDDLLRWLVDQANEVRLANGPSAQIPLRADLAGADLPAHVKRPGKDFRAMVVDWQKVGENRDRWLDYLNERFRPAP